MLSRKCFLGGGGALGFLGLGLAMILAFSNFGFLLVLAVLFLRNTTTVFLFFEGFIFFLLDGFLYVLLSLVIKHLTMN
jgi:hypothetical protein